MPTKKSPPEEFSLNGAELLAKVKELLTAGNARKIIIKNDKNQPVLEIPLTIGAVGALAVPVLAAVGTLAALLSKCSITVVKKK